jgi:hypothetical protein
MRSRDALLPGIIVIIRPRHWANPHTFYGALKGPEIRAIGKTGIAKGFHSLGTFNLRVWLLPGPPRETPWHRENGLRLSNLLERPG